MTVTDVMVTWRNESLTWDIAVDVTEDDKAITVTAASPVPS